MTNVLGREWELLPVNNCLGLEFVIVYEAEVTTSQFYDLGMFFGRRRDDAARQQCSANQRCEASNEKRSAHGISLEPNWSGRRDSNPRPRPWQGRALPLSYTRIRLATAAADRAHLCQKPTVNATLLRTVKIRPA